MREYQTSEEQSHLNSNFDEEFPTHIRRKSFDPHHLRGEINQQDHLDNEQAKYKQLDAPINLICSPRDGSHENTSQDFVATNELIKIFTSEGDEKKDDDPKGVNKHKMFDNHSFKDFTKNKMDEILHDKQFDERNTLDQERVHYGASEEKKDHKKLQIQDSPGSIRSKKLNIEKWVDTDVDKIYREDEDQIRSKTLKIICDQNTPKNENNDGYFSSQPSVTDRVSNLIQGAKSIESNISSDKGSSLKKNTVDELLKTNSDDQFEREDINTFANPDSERNTRMVSDFSTPRFIQDEKPEEADYLQDTLELIKEDFKKYGLSPDGEEGEDHDFKDHQFGIHINFAKKDQVEEDLSDKQNYSEDLAGIEHEDQFMREPEKDDEIEDSKIPDVDKIEISEKIADHLIKEVETRMFPKRSTKSDESSNNLMEKYSEKAVFHLKSIEQPVESNEESKENNEESDTSLDAIEDAIMANFNLIRNFEMKRTRSDKNAYDSEVFQTYVNEVFSAIQTRSDLFLKAFSKPIQKDFLEQLNILHFYGLPEQQSENPDESLIDNLDDQASILTIDLYLSLEKKREEENERISNVYKSFYRKPRLS